MRTKDDTSVRFLPSSIVPRKPLGDPMGPRPPWSSGKESRGNRLEIGSLWRVFAYFLHVEKVGRRRRRDMAMNSRDKRRIRRNAGGLTAAAGTGTGRGRFALRRDPISQRGEMGERRARGISSERTSLTPFPQNRDTAKTPYRSVAPPLQIETYRFDLRRTFRRNLQAATKGSCAVFRRIRTRNPSPSARGLRPP